MASLNKIILIGNLTRDPEVRYTPKGSAVCDVSIAVNRKWKDDAGKVNEDVTYVEIVVWGKTAEHVGQYLKKGSSACFEGRLQMETWDDKTTGQKRSKLKVVAETVQFLNSPNRDAAQPQQSQQRQQQPARSTAVDAVNDAQGDDDIPW
jgi:single-strand DNA-binding protein